MPLPDIDLISKSSIGLSVGQVRGLPNHLDKTLWTYLSQISFSEVVDYNILSDHIFVIRGYLDAQVFDTLKVEED